MEEKKYFAAKLIQVIVKSFNSDALYSLKVELVYSDELSNRRKLLQDFWKYVFLSNFASFISAPAQAAASRRKQIA